MEWLTDPSIWMGLATLVVLEIVLGIDNLVFIAILADKLPPHQRDRARVIGLALALLMRLVLLAALAWIMKLTAPLLTLFEHSFSGRDLILLGGGLFLLFKGTMELHERLEGRAHHEDGKKVYASFAMVVAQIVVLDAVFSLDSVITAVGMVDNLGVMYAAVTIAMALMLLASKPLTRFVNKHPTVVVLCLGFLLMIGFSLVAEGLGYKIPKGYLYAAIAFSILVEAFNQWVRFNRERNERRQPFRQRTADAVLRMLGARPANGHSDDGVDETVDAEERLQPAEHEMIRSVLGLADRPVSSVMTVRADVQWVDLARGQEDVVARLVASPHTRLLVGDGDLDSLRGVVQSRDLLADLLQGRPLQLEGNLREPQYVLSSASALQALELIRQHPVPLAVAVDEYGSVEGLVTANDLLAAIAGDLVDTQDERYGVVAQGEDQWEADGALTLDDLQRLTGVSLPRSADYMTISGLVLEQLGRLPDTGDAVEVAGVRITVLAMEKRRIARLRVEHLDQPL
ncbi:TerC family protein [Stenotrophomonas maltophilia]|uniref:TerC family protein n=1 Tax=Stenotrophomonas maltophilia TaxID=40324 RepID=UPI001F38BCDB|nr:TerC family protein [Stenotrophomonas maltophilia]MCF3525425.1 CBS domain-containing protein [Stenotrophomonas maltophilia]MCF3554595.1 CBS domain-containing protein [Stenotrophomonas maltophilia]